MLKYEELLEALDKYDKIPDKEKHWSKGEDAYFTYVQLKINKKMIDATQSMY